MKLRKEQNKIARDFFKRLKENFDRNLLTHEYSNVYEYETWSFILTEYLIEGTGYYISDIHSNNNYIRCSYRIRQRIKRFLRSEWRKKEAERKRRKLISELDPSRQEIERTFTKTTEVYESLNQN